MEIDRGVGGLKEKKQKKTLVDATLDVTTSRFKQRA